MQLVLVILFGFSGGCEKSEPPSTSVAKAQTPTPLRDGVPVLIDGLYGFVDGSNRIVIPPQFSAATPLHNGYASVVVGDRASAIPQLFGFLLTEEGRAGIIDGVGKFVVEPRFKCLSQVGSDGWAVAAKSWVRGQQVNDVYNCRDWVLVDSSGREVKVDGVSYLYPPTEQRAKAVVRETITVGKTVITRDCTSPRARRMERCYEVVESRAKTSTKTKVGFIDLSGRWAVAAKYDDATLFSEGRAFVISDCKAAIVDKDGALVTGFEFDGCYRSLGRFVSGRAPAGRLDDRGYRIGYVDKQGVATSSSRFDAGFAYSDGMAAIRVSGSWGFIGGDDQLAIIPRFGRVSSFHRGLAFACLLNSTVAVINTRGEVVRPTSIQCLDHHWFVDSLGWYIDDANESFLFIEKGDQGGDWISNQGTVITSPRAADERGGEADSRSTTGTAFALSEDGVLLTNEHVIRGCSVVQLPLSGKTAAVVKSDRGNDLAILKTDITVDDWARLASADDVAVGTEVIVFGFPLGGLLASSGNLTTGVVSALMGVGDDSRFIQITAPIQSGNSGGPVFNKFGEVVGVATMKLSDRFVASQTGAIPQNANFAIGPQSIKAFLHASDVEWREPRRFLRWSKSSESVAESARKMSFLVRCDPTSQH